VKKGFTLIELLGVIVIIGVLALITVPAVDSVVKKGKQRAYDMTKDTIIDAAKNWLTDNKNLFADGDTLTLTLSDLKEQGYLDFDIKNPSSGVCLDNRMEVSITRNEKKYSYVIIDGNLVDGASNDCEAVSITPSIYLLGANPLNIEINTSFTDPGAKAISAEGNDISGNIITNGIVDTSILADNIKYKYTILSDGITKTITRKINVIDTTSPVITGTDDITIYTTDTTFNIMNGVSAIDNSGETITIKTKSNLSLGVKGVYNVTYIATDSSGNTTTVTRKITVRKGISVLKSYSYGNYFWNDAYNTKIESIDFVEYVNTTNSVVSWDLSLANDGSVTGWLMTDSDNPSYYKMYIGSKNYIYANPNSSSLFSGLTSLFSIAFDNFNTSNVTNMSYMFNNATSLNNLDLTVFDTTNVTDMSYMFFNLSNLTNLDIDTFNTSKVTNMAGMFGYLLSLPSLNLSGLDTTKVTDMSNMFAMGYETTKASDIALKSLNLTSFNTSNVTNMAGMFRGFASLTSLNLSNFNTMKVTNMNSMFYNCNSITSLDLSNFNTPNLVSVNQMFNSMDKVQSINLSSFNTSNITDMTGMFRRCHALVSLDLSGFDTSKVTNMSIMFQQSDALINLNLSNFNTANVVDMSYMFSYAYSLTNLNLSNFNTSNVTNMANMFQYANHLVNLDLSSFNTALVTNMDYMFNYASSLNLIYVGSNWTTAGATTTNMFTGCGTSTVTLK